MGGWVDGWIVFRCDVRAFREAVQIVVNLAWDRLYKVATGSTKMEYGR